MHRERHHHNSPASQAQGRSHRKVKNYLLDARIQTRMGILSVVMAAVFTGCTWGIIDWQFSSLAETIIQLTDVPDEVREVLSGSLRTAYLSLGGLALIFALVNILVSVLYTHRLVGPTIAFRRHIRNLISGDYSAKTILRKRDFFVEVADDLNELSEVLRKKSEPSVSESRRSSPAEDQKEP